MDAALPSVGDRAETVREFSPQDVQAFADVSGDRNPIHLDASFAATTRFGRPIVHGMLVSSLFSQLLAEKLPGVGTIYLAQNLNFRRPVFVGQSVRAVVEVTSVEAQRRRVELSTTILDDDGGASVTGTAVVLVPD